MVRTGEGKKKHQGNELRELNEDKYMERKKRLKGKRELVVES